MIDQTISHYRDLEKLGQGGLGVIYKAENLELERFVALRSLPDDVVHAPQALERFRREALAASALNQPNSAIDEIGKSGAQWLMPLNRMPLKMLTIRSAAAFLLCMSVAPSWSQPAKALQSPPATWSMDRDRVSEVSLDGLWRFHPGDDPDGKLGWAQPNFDDSKWALISSVGGWNMQGYQGMGGFAWYRVKVQDADDSPLSLYIPYCDNSYEVYADGKRIGGLGGMPPHQLDVESTPRTYALPALSSGEPRVLSIAIRVWVDPWMKEYAFGGLENGALIGKTRRIRSQVGLINEAVAWDMGGTTSLAALETLVGLASLALFLLRRQEKESLWFGLTMILYACLGVFDTTYQLFHVISFRLHDSVTTLMAGGSELTLIAFYFRFLRGKRSWLFWLAVLSPVVLLLQLIFYFSGSGSIFSPAALNAIGTLHYLPISIWILSLLIRRSVEGMPDARLLLVPALLQESAKIVDGVTTVMEQAGLIPNTPAWFERTLKWPFTISVPRIADAFFILAILAVLIYRFTRTRQQEEKLSNELEAAREVQQVLIPAEMPPVRGFKVESVYIPASQVGGDFFQIIPVSDAGMLAVIGDVSGKGMPAAMTVSLLVGTVRTLAHYTESPGKILVAMNQRMLARSNGGFTTCLVAHVNQAGTITLANAGHIPPYLGGQEISVECGLPLGLAAESVYPEYKTSLNEGDQMTLLTDGVVEARNREGQLLGFERTAAMATGSAESIARAACEFGQEDDITVVTLTRAREESAGTNEASVLSSSLA